MIISRGRSYIFVHIPKTGGTSLAAALEDRAMKDDILIGDTPKALRRRPRLKKLTTSGRLWKHSRLADVEGIVTEGEMTDLFVFTLVRNPWDRTVSYYHWLQTQAFDHPAVRLARRLDFPSFLRAPEIRASFANEGYGAYVQSPSGKNCCDQFVRLEHIDEDLELVEAHLGFALTPLPHLNASERPDDYRAAYNEADAEIVSDLCAEDIGQFGYAF
jgi:hypothetical protein